MKILLADDLFTISGILTPEECAQLIARGESLGFERAAVRTASGPKMRTDIRDNDRAEFIDAELSWSLWKHLEPFVPPTLDDGTPIGIDDNFRFYRYDPGQRFNRHKDGTIIRSVAVRSRLSCLMYLNADFVGGETVFYSHDLIDGHRPEVASIKPEIGMALLFRHDWWHEGRAVANSRKYVLRSDVFFRFDELDS